MRGGYDRFAEYALRAWDGQRRHGLGGVENVRGGVWVVLKLEWQPLHPRAPPAESLLLSLRGSAGAFCFSFSPITTFFSLLASAATSVLDPEWMLHLLRMFCKFGLYRETLLGHKHFLCNAEHLFGAINKIVVFYHFYALLKLCVDIL